MSCRTVHRPLVATKWCAFGRGAAHMSVGVRLQRRAPQPGMRQSLSDAPPMTEQVCLGRVGPAQLGGAHSIPQRSSPNHVPGRVIIRGASFI